MKLNKSQFIKYLKLLIESHASEAAKQKGLKHKGFGRYADSSGTVVAKSEGGELKFLDKKSDQPSKKASQDPPNDDKFEKFKNNPVVYYSKKVNISGEKKRFHNIFQDKNYHFKYDKEKIKKMLSTEEGKRTVSNRDDADQIEEIGLTIINEVNKNGTLGGDEVELLMRFSREFSKTTINTGISVNRANMLLYDGLNKVFYQEYESRKRQLGDHGIRHIIQNIHYTNKLYDEYNKLSTKKISQRKRFLATLVMLNHDIGYTTKDVRDPKLVQTATKAHPRISTQWLQDDIKEKTPYNNLFSKEEQRWVLEAIITHDREHLDWDKEPELSSIRLADNMAVFQKEKLPMIFKQMPNSFETLTNISKACKEKNNQAVVDSKKSMMNWVKNSKSIKPVTKSSLMHAVREISCFTAKATLGMWAGSIKNMYFEKSKESNNINPVVEIESNEFEKKLQDAGVNLQVDKFRKFLDSFGVKDLPDGSEFNLTSNGKVVLHTKLFTGE